MTHTAELIPKDYNLEFYNTNKKLCVLLECSLKEYSGIHVNFIKLFSSQPQCVPIHSIPKPLQTTHPSIIKH